MSVDPLHGAEQRLTFRFDRAIDPASAPALLQEAEVRLQRMHRLQRDALRAREVDFIECRGALNAFHGAGTEIEKLTDHIDRLRRML